MRNYGTFAEGLTGETRAPFCSLTHMACTLNGRLWRRLPERKPSMSGISFRTPASIGRLRRRPRTLIRKRRQPLLASWEQTSGDKNSPSRRSSYRFSVTRERLSSDSLAMARMLAGTFKVHRLNGLLDGVLKLIEASEGQMCEEVRLEVVPRPLDVVEFRGASHSTVSHGRATKAAREALLVWIGPLSRTNTTGLLRRPGRPHGQSVRGGRSSRLVAEVWTISRPVPLFPLATVS